MSSDLAQPEFLQEKLMKPCSQIPPADQQADGILGIIGFGWGMLRLPPGTVLKDSPPMGTSTQLIGQTK